MDIAAREGAEQASGLDEFGLESLFRVIPTGVILQTADGTVLYANREARNVFRIGEETPTNSASDLGWRTRAEEGESVSSEEFPSAMTLRTGKPVHACIRGVFMPDESQWRWLSIDTEPIFDPPSGALREVLIIFHDITAHKTVEEELHRRRICLEELVAERTKETSVCKEAMEEADRARSEFLANMSHELRTPMHAILGFADMGRQKSENSPKEKLAHYFSRISESGHRLLSLLNDLLDLSKLEAGRMEFRMEEQDLKKAVETAVADFEELAQRKSLRLEVVPTTLNTIACFDYNRMVQVMANLLSNAIKFTPDGNPITITFGEADVLVGQRRTDTKVVSGLSVKVSDSGVGIPEEELELIFDKFIQSSKTKIRDGGTGLGLAICREIVNGHRGEIKARSNPDGGTAFTFVIPRQYVKEYD